MLERSFTFSGWQPSSFSVPAGLPWGSPRRRAGDRSRSGLPLPVAALRTHTGLAAEQKVAARYGVGGSLVRGGLGLNRVQPEVWALEGCALGSWQTCIRFRGTIRGLSADCRWVVYYNDGTTHRYTIAQMRSKFDISNEERIAVNTQVEHPVRGPGVV